MMRNLFVAIREIRIVVSDLLVHRLNKNAGLFNSAHARSCATSRRLVGLSNFTATCSFSVGGRQRQLRYISSTSFLSSFSDSASLAMRLFAELMASLMVLP